VQTLSEKVLAAIGRMTVAAAELEHLLAWIGADRAGGDAAAVFDRPGEPLKAARGSVEFTAAPFRAEFIPRIEAAGAQLAVSQSALRHLWYVDTPANSAVFDDIAGRLLACRDGLHHLVAAHLDAAER
jgi:hypothetical protein